MLLKLLRKPKNTRSNITEEMMAKEEEEEAEAEAEEETDHTPQTTNKRHNIKERESTKKVKKKSREKIMKEKNTKITERAKFKTKNLIITSTIMDTDLDQKELRLLKIQKYQLLSLKIKERSNLTKTISIGNLMSYRTRFKPSEIKS